MAADHLKTIELLKKQENDHALGGKRTGKSQTDAPGGQIRQAHDRTIAQGTHLPTRQ